MGRPGARLLVTGFEPFPGAPVNPTQWLVERLRVTPPDLDGAAAFRAELLPVDYRALEGRLGEIGRAFAPDVVIHFGLAGTAAGFRLERVARNRFESARPDNALFSPADGPICAAAPLLPATLPLDQIYKALKEAGLPVEWSDDAGGYLCNMAMTLTLAGACEGMAPTRTGFVHVPPVGQGAPLSETELEKGAAIILSTALAEAG
jgi:pyroglutamyl-peptidase